MPMFLAHIAISAGFIALVVGTGFLEWLKKQDKICGFAKFVGYTTIIFSITGLLCTTYYAVRYWQDGYFKAPLSITHDKGEMDRMHKMMMEKPGMMDMMKKDRMGIPSSAEPAPASPQDHETHHP